MFGRRRHIPPWQHAAAGTKVDSVEPLGSHGVDLTGNFLLFGYNHDVLVYSLLDPRERKKECKPSVGTGGAVMFDPEAAIESLAMLCTRQRRSM
jgi:hypothetical protein